MLEVQTIIATLLPVLIIGAFSYAISQRIVKRSEKIIKFNKKDRTFLRQHGFKKTYMRVNYKYLNKDNNLILTLSQNNITIKSVFKSTKYTIASSLEIGNEKNYKFLIEDLETGWMHEYTYHALEFVIDNDECTKATVREMMKSFKAETWDFVTHQFTTSLGKANTSEPIHVQTKLEEVELGNSLYQKISLDNQKMEYKLGDLYFTSYNDYSTTVERRSVDNLIIDYYTQYKHNHLDCLIKVTNNLDIDISINTLEKNIESEIQKIELINEELRLKVSQKINVLQQELDRFVEIRNENETSSKTKGHVSKDN